MRVQSLFNSVNGKFNSHNGKFNNDNGKLIKNTDTGKGNF